MSTTEQTGKQPEHSSEWYEIGKRLEESQDRVLKELEEELRISCENNREKKNPTSQIIAGAIVFEE